MTATGVLRNPFPLIIKPTPEKNKVEPQKYVSLARISAHFLQLILCASLKRQIRLGQPESVPVPSAPIFYKNKLKIKSNVNRNMNIRRPATKHLMSTAGMFPHLRQKRREPKKNHSKHQAK